MAGSDSGEGGFTAADALVGVLVISLTLALALQANDVARRSARAAKELRQATAVAAYLATTRLEVAEGAPGVASGQAGASAWQTVSERITGQEPALCRRTITVSVQPSGRQVKLDQVRFCGAR